MDIIPIIGTFLSGLGIFFYGLNLVTAGLSQAGGLGLRRQMTRTTANRISGYGVGYLSGLVLQSVPAVAFVVSSLISVGALTFQSALPIQLGVNAGTSLLVLLAVFNIKTAVLFLVGLAGIIVAFERPKQLKSIATAGLGIGMVFLGLIIVREATAPLAQTEWFKAFLSAEYPLIGFMIAGLILTMLLQTTVGVVILAVTLAGSGVLRFDATLFVILGACTGSSLITLIYSASIKGTAKQLIWSQVIYNFLGVGIFTLLIMAEVRFSIPCLPTLLNKLSSTVQGQTGAFFIIYDHAISLILLLAAPLYSRLMRRLSPELAAEKWSKPVYVNDHIFQVPGTAALALNKEQARLMRLPPRYLAGLGEKTCRKEDGDVDASFASLASEIRLYLRECMRVHNTPELADLLVQLDRCQELIESFGNSVRELCRDLADSDLARDVDSLRLAFTESLDMLLNVAADTFDSDDTFDWQTLDGLTQNRDAVLKKIRSRYLVEEVGLPPKSRMIMLRVFNNFDRIVWLLNRLFEVQKLILKSNGRLSRL